jgi:hypothetical protein
MAVSTCVKCGGRGFELAAARSFGRMSSALASHSFFSGAGRVGRTRGGSLISERLHPLIDNAQQMICQHNELVCFIWILNVYITV